METNWRRNTENIYKALQSDIEFGELGSQTWEATVIECYRLGFNVGFVEEIMTRQQPNQAWTSANQDRAKILEWEFHQPLLTAKYTEGTGKSTQLVIREMLKEKGVNCFRVPVTAGIPKARLKESGPDVRFRTSKEVLLRGVGLRFVLKYFRSVELFAVCYPAKV